MALFALSWIALRKAVAALSDEDFARPSGCQGWLVRDLVCHLVIGAQDVLITLVTPAETGPTIDAAGYWRLVDPPTGADPLDALIPRLAAAYGDPGLLKAHLDDVGSAAGRAAEFADPTDLVSTRGEVLTVNDYLAAYAFEWTLHHLDLIAHLPTDLLAPHPPADLSVPRPPTDPSIPRPPTDLSIPRPPALGPARTILEQIAGSPFPESMSDEDVLLVGTGRRVPTDQEVSTLGDLAARLPLVLG
ncbi:maleylpyruvate isomerase N-terminal domain-containing protein [Actinokineospora diospyrosa]|uniref:Mycothiol maleylpyruvate isomerase N-terminal domain-containing protein n=1 Tax=Actinokineospora diospyrosa TaxID=103728 RepID=A0ABT1IBI9_9PSEU|nr:maleylpyruvate isomerase N-terminal domain-containing protein [Actinokineospora diospyrosa]MCP2269999.1 Mycothiol maleylpyruvate isomerase N-terminal domain-containing protein [Actinokineospora diospyrosa]